MRSRTLIGPDNGNNSNYDYGPVLFRDKMQL